MAASIGLCLLLLLCGRVSRQSQTAANGGGADTVLVKVSVFDRLNRSVTDLEKKHFKVYEDGAVQTISYFAHQSAPISVGIVYDATGSAGADLQSLRDTIPRLLASGNPGDDFFLLWFDVKAAQIQGFSRRGPAVQNDIVFDRSAGRTRLYDAVYTALDRINEGASEKKALVVATAAGDYSILDSALSSWAKGKDPGFQVDVIGRSTRLKTEVSPVVALTGGRAYVVNNFTELDYYIGLIYTELHNQYILGYSPTNKNRDGKWRKISVKLDPPPGSPKLTVRAKAGYFAFPAPSPRPE
jgi:Ca-activated chloride channel family protein